MRWYQKWSALLEAYWKRRGGTPAQIVDREAKSPVVEIHFEYPVFQRPESPKMPPHHGGKDMI